MGTNKSSAIKITNQFVDNICKRISQHKPVRRNLPLNGRLHIDRPLPFICIYRHPSREKDPGTEKLVKGEASYLITSSSSKIKKDITFLLDSIISLISEEYKAFLIIEVWTKKSHNNNSNNNRIGLLDPSINLKISKSHFPTHAVEAMEKSLQKISILRQKIKVKIEFDSKQWPSKMTSIVSSTFAKKRNCFFIGIEVDPFFKNHKTNELYPLVLRKIHQGLSRAIKLGVFQFSHNETTLRPTNYLALGRRAMVKAVWEVDQKLAEISNAFDFLLLVTPINIEQAWSKFKANQFKALPVYYYRPIPINPSLLKSKLFDIPIESIEDPTLAMLFVEKQIELETSLSMLRDRGTRNFFFGSMQLYGEIDEELVSTAQKILEMTPPHEHEAIHSNYYNATMFAERANQEIEYLKQLSPNVHSQVQIRDDITGLMVAKGNLLLGRKVRIPERRVEALLQHEIGTHILTYINGRAQPFQQLYTGLAGYDELQEGLAVLSEYLVGGLSNNRLRLLAARVLAASYLIDGATFIDTFRILYKKFAFSQRIAYIVSARIFRGGGLTKDAVYLRGLIRILDYLSQGGELEPLLVGKISSEHIPIIKELQARKVLNPILLHPRYIENESSIEKLKELKKGLTVLDLINRR